MSVLDAVPLKDAVLCAECEVITGAGGGVCPMCGSRSLLCLSRVLGGTVGYSRAVMVSECHHQTEAPERVHFRLIA